ncbi:MAG TPA: hypothetical protein VK548_18855 [Candidatus Acidoferrum sp.]|nr:hypothetical protein [Candidatus Acidoferrum sp.]
MNVPDERGLKLLSTTVAVSNVRDEMNVPDERGLKQRVLRDDRVVEVGGMNVPDERGLKRDDAFVDGQGDGSDGRDERPRREGIEAARCSAGT